MKQKKRNYNANKIEVAGGHGRYDCALAVQCRMQNDNRRMVYKRKIIRPYGVLFRYIHLLRVRDSVWPGSASLFRQSGGSPAMRVFFD